MEALEERDKLQEKVKESQTQNAEDDELEDLLKDDEDFLKNFRYFQSLFFRV